MSETRIAPIVKNIVVPLPPQEAYTLFTNGIARWWPLASPSVGGDHSTNVVFEPEAGGPSVATQLPRGTGTTPAGTTCWVSATGVPHSGSEIGEFLWSTPAIPC